MTRSLELSLAAIRGWLEAAPRPLIVGICGAQGSGKSTLAQELVEALRAEGLRAATLSLDDLYLGKAERAALAREIHPLLATRGVPLTHNVTRGEILIGLARRKHPLRFLPRFDKASDEPLPLEQGEPVEGALDLLIFEGWCVGARPEEPDALVEPVNALERDEDPEGIWRRTVNDALAGPYRAMFERIDRLILLAAPGFEVVDRWRTQQEDELRARLAAEGRDPGLAMNPAQIARFIQHYERITRAILAEMPARADLVIQLDSDRKIRGAE